MPLASGFCFCRAFRSHQQTVLVSFLEPGRGVDGWQSPVDCSGLLSRRTLFLAFREFESRTVREVSRVAPLVLYEVG